MFDTHTHAHTTSGCSPGSGLSSSLLTGVSRGIPIEDGDWDRLEKQMPKLGSRVLSMLTKKMGKDQISAAHMSVAGDHFAVHFEEVVRRVAREGMFPSGGRRGTVVPVKHKQMRHLHLGSARAVLPKMSLVGFGR